jgi:hypothetical protein
VQQYGRNVSKKKLEEIIDARLTDIFELDRRTFEKNRPKRIVASRYYYYRRRRR